MYSLISKEETETKGLEELIKNMSNRNDVIELVRKLDKVFQKFKSNNKIVSAVMEFSISDTSINFKRDIVKFIEN